MLYLHKLKGTSMRYVPRALTQTIRRAMSTFPAVLVTGARQTGKTTLLRTEFGDSHQYLFTAAPARSTPGGE
jgi:predicted AAA+ superfamily ATPase